MKVKQFLILGVLALLAAAVTGCASHPTVQTITPRQAAIDAATPIRTMPAERPAWVDFVPHSTTTLSFVGSAGRFATETGNQGSRFFAHENGRVQMIDFIGTAMVNQARTHAATYGISSDVLAPQIAGQQLNERIAQNVAQALAPRAYFTQVFLDTTHREAFETFVWMEVEKAIVRRAIDLYGNEQAANFARQAAVEQDMARRQQLERAAQFFGGNLGSRLLGD